MPRLRFVVCLLLLTALAPTAWAEDEVGDEPPVPVEKHKPGTYTIETPGVPAVLYYTVGHAFAIDPPADHFERIKAGKLRWMTPPYPSEGASSKYMIEVPANYDPQMPHGILVWVDSGDRQGLPPEYKSVLEKYHLIGASAGENGNSQDALIRQVRAVHLVQLLKERYNIDDDRVYVSGRSGGGKVCSHAMIMNSDVFSGGLPIMGANPCMPMVNAAKEVKFDDEGSWKRPDMNLARRAATNGRFVFLTGEKDFNRLSLQCVAEGYRQKGFKYIQYIEQPGAAHGLVSLDLFEQGLDFADAPLKESAPKDFEMAKRALAAKKLDQALIGFRKAAAHGGEAEFVADAKTQAVELGEQYQETLDAAQAAIDKDPKTATFAIAKLKKDWLAVSKADYDRLIAQQKAAQLKKPAKSK